MRVRDCDNLLSAHLLLPDDILVSAHRAQPQEVSLLLGHPVTELPEADKKRAQEEEKKAAEKKKRE